MPEQLTTRLRAHLAAWLSALGVLICCGEAFAQEYPTRPVRVLVGSAPGGVSDFAARMISPYLSSAMGNQFVIENRPGGTGSIAAAAAASSDPDGYVLFMGNAADMTVSPALGGKLPYNTLKDFAPIVAISETALALAVHPSIPAGDLRDLISLAKSKAGSLAYASAGSGTVNHVVGEWFKSVAGIQMIHIPYKGGGPATQEVVAGIVPVGVIAVSAAVPQERGGRLKILAVSSAKRLAFKPEWPTIAESGFSGFEASVWAALFAPAATPKAIVSRLNTEVNRVLQMPQVRERLNGQGAEILGGSSEDLNAMIRRDLERYAGLIHKFGIRRD